MGINEDKRVMAVPWERWCALLHKGYDETLNLSNEGAGESSVS